MTMLGALVGAAIDRSDGDSGIKGAIIGAGLSKTASVLAPLVMTFVIGWALQKAVGAAWNAMPDIGGDQTRGGTARG
jgi:hypothetical protein